MRRVVLPVSPVRPPCAGSDSETCVHIIESVAVLDCRVLRCARHTFEGRERPILRKHHAKGYRLSRIGRVRRIMWAQQAQDSKSMVLDRCHFSCVFMCVGRALADQRLR